MRYIKTIYYYYYYYYKNKLLSRSMSHHDIYNSTNWSSTSVLNHHLQYDLKTNVRDEQVCSMKTSSTTLTPKHSSPHCVAEWGVSGFNGRANGFENLNCRRGPRTLFTCPLHPPYPHSAKRGKGTVFRDQRIVALVSVADYDLHKGQDLTSPSCSSHFREKQVVMPVGNLEMKILFSGVIY